MVIDARRALRAAPWLMAGVAGVFLAGPSHADTTVTVRMPNCNGCTIIAVSSVQPGWDAIDEARTLRRSAKVRHGVARLHVPTSRTRGLAFAVDAGRYSAGNAVAMAVMRYAGMTVGGHVSAGQSAGAGSGSFCWGGTRSRRASLHFASHRSVNRDTPPASPDRYIIRVWASPGTATLRDDLNMHTTNGGGLGIQQGPFCFDDQPPPVGSRPIPAGRTYLRTTTAPGTRQLLLVERTADSVSYVFLPSAGTPGCFRGTYVGGQLLGDSVSLYESGLLWDQSPRQLQVGRRTWSLDGQKWRRITAGQKQAKASRRALDATLQRCAGVPWQPAGASQPAAPQPAVPAPDPVPVPVTPTPPPSAPPPPPPPPPAATIVVNTCNTYNNCDVFNPIYVHSNPAVSSRIGDVGRGTALTARCWATGRTLTDGSNNTSEDDARQFTSSLWYGIDWNGGRGYVPAVWTTKREDHLGLPGC